MYSCAKGEYSIDTPKGGAYSKNLIEAAYSENSIYIYFGRTHEKAADKTTMEAKIKNNIQNPEIVQQKILTSQQLIFGICPDLI